MEFNVLTIEDIVNVPYSILTSWSYSDGDHCVNNKTHFNGYRKNLTLFVKGLDGKCYAKSKHRVDHVRGIDHRLVEAERTASKEKHSVVLASMPSIR